MTNWLVGKYRAARSLHSFWRHFSNWRDVWAAYRAGRPIPPLAFREGLVLHHGDGDDPIALFREVVVDECYTGRWFYCPNPGDTVIDLGANIGTCCLHLNRLARGLRVHCYEPVPSTRERLLVNIRENRLIETCTVYPEAVSDRAGTLEFFLGHGPAQNSLLAAADTGKGRMTVATLDLNVVVARCPDEIALVKMDIEGAEVEALSGAGAEVWPRVRRFAVEYHDAVRPGSKDATLRVLNNHGYDTTIVHVSSDRGYGIIHAIRRK